MGRIVSLTVVALLTLPAVGGAQVVGLAASLISKVEDVGAYAIWPVSMSQHTHVGTGIGMEISIHIASKEDTTLWARTNRCKRVRRAGRNCDLNATRDTSRTVNYQYLSARADTVIESGQVVRIQRRGPVVDSTVSMTVSAITETIWSASLAVASKSTPLRSDTLFQGWTLGGRIQEYPTLTLYVAFLPERMFSLYLGATVAPTELKNARLTLGDSAASVEGSTVGLGGTAGVVGEFFGFVQLFGEFEYTAASFQSLGWKRPQSLPANAAPSQLDLKGLRFSAGVQVPLGLE